MPIATLGLQLALGFFASLAIGLLAYWRKSLSESGTVAAVVVGTLVFGFGGWAGAALLLGFFVSSTVLSRYKAAAKEAVSQDFSKGSRRDMWQALANGGVAAIAAVLAVLTGQPAVWLAMVGALAAANADTWATELGVLSKTHPRLITSGVVVAPGTSGAVSVQGTLAALIGAGFIAGVGGLFWGATGGLLAGVGVLVVGSVAGLAGSLFDSLLGATVQASFYCDVCQKETEKHPTHRCGNPTHQIRGQAWMNNDVVNLLATLCGALVAAGVWWLLG